MAATSNQTILKPTRNGQPVSMAQTEFGEGSGDLPEGWLVSNISDIVTINYGKGLRKADRSAGPVPVYGSNGKVGWHKLALTSGPTIIVGRKGSIGAAHFSGCRCWPIDTTYYIDEFNGLYPEYLVNALRTLNLGDLDKSTAIPGLNRDDLYAQSIPLPPLAEQQRIAAKVEELLAKVSAAKAHLERVPTIMNRFRQAVLAAACSGKLTEDWRRRNASSVHSSPAGRTWDVYESGTGGDLDSVPEQWKWSTIGAVATVQGGIQKQPKRAPKENPYPYLRVANVLRGELDLSEVHTMELFDGELETYRLKPNDLLIVEGNGSLDEVGRCALWTGEIDECVHQNHIIRVRAHAALPQYLCLYWNSPVGRERLAQIVVTTAGLYSLSTGKVKSFPVPLPPGPEQEQIVRQVHALFQLAEAIEKRVALARARVDKLTRAILAKAFRGELVPTEAELARREGRAYEPASLLLERIKKGRQARKTGSELRA